LTRLDFTYSPWLIVICLSASAALSWWLYSKDPGAIPKAVRWLLLGFRFVVFSICSILLLEPLINWFEKVSYPPIVVILQDDSESIAIQRDSNFVRNELPGELKNLLQRFDGTGIEPRYYTFSDQLTGNTDPDSLKFSRSGTNISSALAEVRKLYQNQNLGAIILLTDGISTSGSNPGYSLDEFTQPIYTVLLGDTAEQKDLRIAEVLVNEISYLGNETPVKVKISASGIEDTDVSVSLTRGDKVLGSQQVRIGTSNPSVEADFMLKPDTTGVLQYVVHLSEIPGELTMRNNHKAIFIHVLETKIRIGIFGGSPHPDIGAILKALKRDNRYDLVELIHKDRQSFYQQAAGLRLEDLDLLILHNFPISSADAPWVEKIVNAINQEKIPVMFFAGLFTDLQTAKPLLEYLAISPSAISSGFEEVQPNFGAAYMDHSTFTFDRDWINMMNSSPPLLRNRSDWKAQGDALVCATTTIRNVKLDYPFYALRQNLGRKSVVVTGEGIWRIRAHCHSELHGFDAFDIWIGNNVQWLVVQDDKRKFRVNPSKPLFSGNELITFKGQVYDESYHPVRGAEIKLKIRDENSRENVFYMNESGEGHYFLEFSNLAEGTYSYSAAGNKGEVELGKDNGQFSVGKSSIEHFNLRADDGLLRQIALRTGGRYYQATELQKLGDEIAELESMKPVVEFRRTRKGFQEFIPLFFLIFAILAVEWTVRKVFSLT